MQSPLFDEQQQQRQQAGQPAQVWGRWAEHTQRQGDGAGQSLWIVACRLTRYKWTAAARLLLADSRTYETRKTRLESMSLSSVRSEEHTSELQSPCNLVCRLLLEKKEQHYT